MTFTIYEEKIIRVLGRHPRGLTINEISTATRISWVTVRKYVKRLYNRRVLSQKTISGRIYWMLNY